MRVNGSKSTPGGLGVIVPGDDDRPATLSKELGRRVRPRTFRRFVVLFMAGWLAAAALTTAGVVRADTDRELLQYAIQHEALICGQLAADPTVGGLDGILARVQYIGQFEAYDSGRIVAMAVQDACPHFLPVLRQYAAMYAGVAA